MGEEESAKRKAAGHAETRENVVSERGKKYKRTTLPYVEVLFYGKRERARSTFTSLRHDMRQARVAICSNNNVDGDEETQPSVV